MANRGSGTIEKIEKIHGLPEPGREYLVRCTAMALPWTNRLIPMLWLPHKPGLSHFHVDTRFLNDEELAAIAQQQQHYPPPSRPQDRPATWAGVVAGEVIGVTVENDGLLTWGWFPRRCYRATFPARSPVADVTMQVKGDRVVALDCNNPYMLETLTVGGDRHYCPHQGTPLRGLPVDAGGCVVCPAHHLRIKTHDLA
ncbi:hypothetical protein [Thermoleptolyngbya sp. M55_K2018_002]|uniref:hypothetical protein n=1 Tax=Thermoleptolyngbya sp. M55_K2018_002 TaxID=2747808 RepID=UPI0019F7DC2F|nr:hypothetical protein [Thermoleptolyngbya sp. M55_K2018_002]HIK39781.1 hypothetical protein [Thermoleptolyngbya sp. M55_K2018_002]